MQDLNLTAVEQEVVQAATAFAEDYLRPNSRQWELDRRMPREAFLAAGEAGLCGLLVSPERGGKGVSFTAFLKVMEELSYVDQSAAFGLVVQNNHARFIDVAGGPALVEDHLAAMLAGRTIGAFLLTEPQGGSERRMDWICERCQMRNYQRQRECYKCALPKSSMMRLSRS